MSWTSILWLFSTIWISTDEETAGYERLLAFPGCDVAAIAGKCGKSQIHTYARLALHQLLPEAAEAFQHEKTTPAMPT